MNQISVGVSIHPELVTCTLENLQTPLLIKSEISVSRNREEKEHEGGEESPPFEICLFFSGNQVMTIILCIETSV